MSVSAIGLILLASVFFAGSENTENGTGSDVLEVELGEVLPGTYKTVMWKGFPTVIYRMNEVTTAYLISINDQVYGEPITKETASPFYVYKAVSTHLGCGLRPAIEKNDAKFNKGWFDPCHLGVWDYSGRLFKNLGLPSGMTLDHLYPVPFQLIDGRVIRLLK